MQEIECKGTITGAQGRSCSDALPQSVSALDGFVGSIVICSLVCSLDKLHSPSFSLNKSHPEVLAHTISTERFVRDRPGISRKTATRLIGVAMAEPDNARLAETGKNHLADPQTPTQVEEHLRRTQYYLTEAERLSHSGSFVWDVGRPGPVYWSPRDVPNPRARSSTRSSAF